MADRQAALILQHIRKLAATGAEHIADRELVRRFVTARDEAAFAALVRRHGSMVQGVCQRVLHNWHDAEDVFQATFLVLSRKAASLRRRESVGNWLYGVAYRLALKARSQAAHRTAHPGRTAAPRPADPLAQLTGRELVEVLDEELVRLPEKYRAPLVLCYLEGTARDEAAQRLGCSLSTLKRRLECGRERLRTRLGRRGLTLSAGLLVPLLTPGANQAAVPVTLLASTIKAALSFRFGPTAPAAGVSVQVTRLAEGVLRSMLITKLKITVVLFLAVSLGAAGASVLAGRTLTEERPPVRQEAGSNPKAKEADPPKLAAGEQARTDLLGDPLPPGALARLGTLRLWHGGMIDDGALSRDGMTLATAGRGMIRLWDLRTGKLRRVLDGAHLPGGYADPAKCLVAFSPDGKTLASGGTSGTAFVWDGPKILDKEKIMASRGTSGTAFLWDVETGKEKRRLTGHEGQVHTVAFSPDGKTLATATDKGDIRFWNPDTGKEQWQLAGRHFPGHSMIVVSPDGRSAAAYGDDDDGRFCVDIYDLATRKKLRRLEHGKEQIGRACFSPDGRMLATGGGNLTLRLWQVESGALLRDLSRPAPPADSEPYWVTALSFSPDGKALAVGYSDHAIYLWDPATGKQPRTFRGHAWFPTALSFTPDSRILVSVSLDATARRWDVATGEEIPAAGNEVRHSLLARSPDGNLLATCGGVGAIHLIDAATGRTLRTLPGHGGKAVRLSDEGKVFQLAFAPDGKVLASAGADQTIRLWDVTTGHEVRALHYPEAIGEEPDPRIRGAEITALVFSPDGRILAGANRYKRVTHIWEVASGNELRQLPLGPFTTAMTFLLDGKTLVDGSSWNQPPLLSFWDTTTGQKRLTIPIEKDEGSANPQVVVASPDGRFLATGHSDRTIRIWDLLLRRELRRLRGHRGMVVSLSFSPDGKWLASGGCGWRLASAGWDKMVRVWEVMTGQEVYRLDGHEADVLYVAFGADLRNVASCSLDTTALVWNLRPPPSDAPAGLEALWAALAGTDTARAYRTAWRLADNGERAVRFLEERLRPVPEVAGERWRKLLDQLDSNRPAEREAVSRELAKLGYQIEMTLVRTAEQTGSAEVRRRVLALLEALSHELPSPEALQQSRAVQVLELLGTAEARRLLKILAQGAPEARLTQEAKSCLQRLANRPAAPP